MAQIPELSGPSVPPATGAAPRRLVVLLHGVGADGNDLIGLAPFYQRAVPDALFVAPNGPEAFDMAPMGYQWFSLQDFQPETRLNGVRAAAPVVNAFIDGLLAQHGLTESDLVLIGFSQGAMVALHVGLRREPSVAGIISHSGMLVGPELLNDEIKVRPPVLLSHGSYDQVLPVHALPAAEEALKGADVPVEAYVRPGLGHGIDPETIGLALGFLGRVFPEATP